MTTDTLPAAETIVHAKWRNKVSINTTPNPVIAGQNQIEIKIYNNTTGKWGRALYFQSLAAFDEFIDTLDSAAEAIENAQIVPEEDAPRTGAVLTYGG
jgi:hypothetical protein